LRKGLEKPPQPPVYIPPYHHQSSGFEWETLFSILKTILVLVLLWGFFQALVDCGVITILPEEKRDYFDTVPNPRPWK